MCKLNPCASVSVTSVLGKKKPVLETKSLTEEELRNLLPMVDSTGRSHGLALRIFLSTATRKNELRRARWEHIDLDAGLWVIPEQNCKNGSRLKS